MPSITLPRDASFRGLFAPNRRYDYFSAAAEAPFRPYADNYDPVNAWWLAELSLLEYVPNAVFKAERLRRAGFHEARQFEGAPTHTQCLVAHNESTVLVVFRGTEVDSLRDVLTDVNIVWSREPGGGKVHRGFKLALDSVWGGLESHLKELASTRSVYLGGHSLGGALATLAAHRLAGTVRGLYTFGCPRVGDQSYAGNFQCPAWRVVNSNDIVARVPPFPYFAVGRLCYLDRHGRLLLDAPTPSRWDDRWRGHARHAEAVLERWWAGDWNVVFNDELYDHAPIHYARWLRRLALAPQANSHLV